MLLAVGMYIKSAIIENKTMPVKNIPSFSCQKFGANNGINAIDNSTRTMGAISNNISNI